jgi:phage tail-like protein
MSMDLLQAGWNALSSAGTSQYPPVGFHFRVEFLGVTDDAMDARFQEVSGLAAELQVEELIEGGENRFVHRLPTRAKYGNLVLKRGLVKDSKLIEWCSKAIVDFEIRPADVNVSLLNEKHEPLLTYSFINAWPVKWSATDLKAQENSIVIETLELAYAFHRRV